MKVSKKKELRTITIETSVLNELMSYLESEKHSLRQCINTPTVSERRKALSAGKLDVVTRIQKSLQFSNF